MLQLSLIKSCEIQRNNFMRSTKELFSLNELFIYLTKELFSFNELFINSTNKLFSFNEQTNWFNQLIMYSIDEIIFIYKFN